MTDSGLSNCGCCEGVHDNTPARIDNRPGLKEISYRAGVYGQFRQSMRAGLTSAKRPGLRALGTRDDDDFSIALIDAWAVACDVLTFYAERTANEHYLATATERRSITGLVDLIGYHLRPGVAAGAWLAFTLENVPGSPDRVPIDAGTRVQTLPGPGELPQTFETTIGIQAFPSWNVLRPRLTKRQLLKNGDTSAVFEGTGLNVNTGDALLFVDANWDPTTRNNFCVVRVARITPDREANNTTVAWEPALSNLTNDPAPGDVLVFVMRQRAALFGYNAPDPKLFVTEVQNKLKPSLSWSPAAVDQPASVVDWDFAKPGPSAGNGELDLDALYPGLARQGWVVLNGGAQLAQITVVREVSVSKWALSGKVTSLTLTANGLSTFGGTSTRTTSILLGSEPLPLAKIADSEEIPSDQIDVEGSPASVLFPRTVLVRGQAAPSDATATQGEVTGEMAVVMNKTVDQNVTTLHIAKPLKHSYKRATFQVYGNVAKATHGEAVGMLDPARNVREEVLGSGDGSKSYQRFTLSKEPLTYVQASGPQGGATTLSVRVNGVLWREVPTLFSCEPTDRVYITRTSDDGKTVVQFGDGVTGARLPSGIENVRASYRAGSGMQGEARPEQLSLLLTRPLGLKGVTNPLAASGAQDPQRQEDARANAPRSVLTMDRIVSLKDYEDFTRNFSGVGKAAAVWTWDGHRRGVYITVAGVDGAAATGELLDHLLKAFVEYGNPRTSVVVKSYRRATFAIHGSVWIDPVFETDAVLKSVRTALTERFSFALREFGQMVAYSEVAEAIQSVRGVIAVDIDSLRRTGSSNSPTGLNLAAAAPRSGDLPTVNAAELLIINPTDASALSSLGAKHDR